jgi:hypothetical protein
MKGSTWLTKAILLCLVVLLSHQAGAQPGVTISRKSLTAVEVYQLLNQYRNHESITFQGCTITYGERDDDYRFAMDDYTDFESANGFQSYIPKPIINAEVNFSECSFNATDNRAVEFSNIYFKGQLTLDNSNGYGLEFSRCVFWDGIVTTDVKFRYLELINCQFYHSFGFNDDEITQLKLTQCEFVRNDNSVAFGLNFVNRNQFYDFLIYKCEFLDQSKASQQVTSDSLIHQNNLLYLKTFDADHFHVSHSIFDCSIVFGDFAIEKSFAFKNNRYYQKVAFEQAPNIPIENSVFSFTDLVTVSPTRRTTPDSLGIKIGIIKELPNEMFLFYRYDSDWEYGKDQVRPWIDTTPEKQIIPVYSKLLSVFNASSDIESYNLCFRQMKRIEKTASKVRWETQQKFIDWFRWKMDIFLEKFSAYGTDPVLSLFNSFLVICAFALIYIVFPSEEDNLRFHNIQTAVYRYVAHFAEQQKQFLTTDELYQRDLEAGKAMKEQLRINIEKLPPVVSFLGMPFYYVSYFFAFIRHRLRSMVRFNIYQDWTDLNAMGRFKTSVVVSINFVGFLLWGLIMRLVNGFTLSLNAFVTLGYGEIEAKGIARYFCVIEGLVGWFLLSVFSVSLISQILQ